MDDEKILIILVGLLVLTMIIAGVTSNHIITKNTRYVCIEHGMFGTPNTLGFHTLEDFNNYYENEAGRRNANCYIDNRITHKSCYYDDSSLCGKTVFCPTHVSEKECLVNGGTWDFETLERDMKTYPQLSIFSGGKS